ncbi:hypothetical protein HDV06_000076 [Boothiomyces sp. JEL0866]|nr:hypothetical protein HDV06_000076 [Boothiomyces sp. JEL0866]
MQTQLLQATSENIEKAAQLLAQGNVVAFPTETVYGLGANALDKQAVEKIYQAKGRPSDNPLIVHVSSISMLKKLLHPNTIPAIYEKITAKYWPGPLTILVPKPSNIPDIVTAGQKTLAVRIPAHDIARNLIEKCGFPLAAPSANTSGRPSPTLAIHVYEELNGRIPMILDGGSCDSGLESTVLDGLRETPSILRPGGVTFESLLEDIPNLLVYRKDFVDKNLEDAPSTPGMKYRHYTPNGTVIVVENTGSNGQLSAIKDIFLKYPNDKIGVLKTGLKEKFNLEIDLGDTAELVARNLFGGLRDMEKLGATVIIVQGISEDNEGLAVMNRLRKAAKYCIA